MFSWFIFPRSFYVFDCISLEHLPRDSICTNPCHHDDENSTTIATSEPEPMTESTNITIDRYEMSTVATEDQSSVNHTRNPKNKDDKKGNLSLPVLEDENWWWPEGFDPPSWLKDDEKLELVLRAIQEFNEPYIDNNGNSTRTLLQEYRPMAEKTYFSVDLKTICRYLEACQFKPLNGSGKSATQRIVDTIKWRAAFPHPIIDKKLLRKELETGKCLLHGNAKDGTPIVYIIPSRENSKNPSGNVKAILYTLERAIQSISNTNVLGITCVLDCQGVGMMNTPSTKVIYELIEVLGKHMPRRLGRVYVINVSSVFYFLWNVISGTLSETTLKKIQIISDSKQQQLEVIGQHIDPKVLLKEYGGENPYVFDVDKYLLDDEFLQHKDKRKVYS